MKTRIEYTLKKPWPVFIGGLNHAKVVPAHLIDKEVVSVLYEGTTHRETFFYVRTWWYDSRCGAFPVFAIQTMTLNEFVQRGRIMFTLYRLYRK